jgi:vacuolar-type H+-ATPase subunit I/STV1
MNATHLGILENNIEVLKSASNKAESHETTWESIRLLLESLDFSQEELAAFDRKEIVKVASRMKAVAQKACDFYRVCSEPGIGFDLKTENAKIDEKLKASTAMIEETNQLLEKLTQQEAELLKREGELQKLSEEHKVLQEKVALLKEIEATVGDGMEVREKFEFYKLHLGENSKIYESLKSFGIALSEDIRQQVEAVKSAFENELQRYDDILTGLLQGLEDMKNETLEKQNRKKTKKEASS